MNPAKKTMTIVAAILAVFLLIGTASAKTSWNKGKGTSNGKWFEQIVTLAKNHTSANPSETLEEVFEGMEEAISDDAWEWIWNHYIPTNDEDLVKIAQLAVSTGLISTICADEDMASEFKDTIKVAIVAIESLQNNPDLAPGSGTATSQFEDYVNGIVHDMFGEAKYSPNWLTGAKAALDIILAEIAEQTKWTPPPVAEARLKEKGASNLPFEAFFTDFTKKALADILEKAGSVTDMRLVARQIPGWGWAKRFFQDNPEYIPYIAKPIIGTIPTLKGLSFASSIEAEAKEWRKAFKSAKRGKLEPVEYGKEDKDKYSLQTNERTIMEKIQGSTDEDLFIKNGLKALDDFLKTWKKTKVKKGGKKK